MFRKQVLLHIINSLDLGGAEVLLRDTVEGLRNFTHVICYLRPPKTLEDHFKGAIIYNLEHNSWYYSLATIYKIRSIIRKHNVDLVHAHLFDATIIARLAVPSEIPFFFTIHNVLSKDAFEVNLLSRWVERVTYCKRQHLISVSEEALKDYNKWIGVKGPYTVLYNYVNQKFFDYQYDYTRNVRPEFKLIAVGNLRRQKNYFKLLEAFKLLKDLPISLDIYGSGTLKEELDSIIESNSLSVRLMGRVDDVVGVLPNYHAYIMASVFEGFGIAPMEAMAAGMPVLLSNLEVFKEVSEDIPIYFDPNSPKAIADAIYYAWSNWSELIHKAQRGKGLIAAKASRQQYFNNLIKVYNLH